MRLSAFHALVLVLVLPLCPEVKSDPGCEIETDGCSIPEKFPFFYKKTFRRACVKHDVCYACGSYYGWSRETCDTAYLRDMRKLCKSKRCLKGVCRMCARLYYEAFKLFGKKEFEDDSPKWCHKKCAKRRGNPARTVRG